MTGMTGMTDVSYMSDVTDMSGRHHRQSERRFRRPYAPDHLIRRFRPVSLRPSGRGRQARRRGNCAGGCRRGPSIRGRQAWIGHLVNRQSRPVRPIVPIHFDQPASQPAGTPVSRSGQLTGHSFRLAGPISQLNNSRTRRSTHSTTHRLSSRRNPRQPGRYRSI